MLKKISSGLLAIIILLSTSVYASSLVFFPMKFQIDEQSFYFAGDNIVHMDVAPFLCNKTQRTYLPMRVISERCGYKVIWEEDLRKIRLESYEKNIELTIDSNIINVLYRDDTLEDQIIYSDAVPVIRDSRTFIPLRIVSEIMGYHVYWKDDSREVILTENKTLEKFPYLKGRLECIKDDNDFFKYAYVVRICMVPDEELTERAYVNFDDKCDEKLILETLGEKAIIKEVMDLTGSYYVEYDSIEEMRNEVLRLNELEYVNYAEPV